VTFQNLRFFLPLLFCIVLLSKCTKTEDITYDVYFWSPSITVGQENTNIFIDGVKEGILINPSVEVDCTVEEAILGQLVFLQLSNGVHEIEVRNENGEVKNSSSLEIKTNRFSNSVGLSSEGTVGGVEVNGSDECLSVKITF
jgi:hypothetical protein